MTAEEKELVRALVAVYAVKPATESDMQAWNAHAENAEQELPWRDDPARAAWLQDVAWRAARVRW